ncbi:MAG: tRNA adenosine(34) deaminase [Candidatus Westeberhardia cardiocondylae]|nr:tRNA adenosine(34) deaminase [Candidatus Westeberhardia cardiocondylae]
MKIFCHDSFWMYRAIMLANRAEMEGEIPIGSVVVLDNEIIGEGWNKSIQYSDPSAHAEIVSLRESGKNLNNYRLVNTTIYVTQEPCIMCIGAIINARVKRLVFGSKSKKNCVINILFKFFPYLMLNNNISITYGVLETLCNFQIVDFFKRKR